MKKQLQSFFNIIIFVLLTVFFHIKFVEQHETLKNSELIVQPQVTNISINNKICFKERKKIFGIDLYNPEMSSVSYLQFEQLQNLSACLPEVKREQYLQNVRFYNDARNSKNFWRLISFSSNILISLILISKIWSLLSK